MKGGYIMRYTDMDIFPVIVSLRQAQRASEAMREAEMKKCPPEAKRSQIAGETLRDIVALFAGIGAVLSIYILAAAL